MSHLSPNPFLTSADVGQNLRSIAILPSWSDELASSRIRAYSLGRALMNRGVKVSFGFNRTADVVVVQKGVSPEILRHARAMKQLGKIVVYDTDEARETLKLFSKLTLISQMFEIADLVITDTAGHRKQLMRDFRCKNIAVVPDAIDYYPDAPFQSLVRPRSPLRILWFGNAMNFRMMLPYIDALMEMQDVQMVVVTDGFARDLLARTFSNVEFFPWMRDDFVKRLQSCDLSCLVHDNSENARYKSNNKMIASIHWGVPAIVSDSVEYARTASECGINDAVFSDIRSLRDAIGKFRSPEARQWYLEKAQPIVWKHYAPDVVAETFLKAVLGLPANRAGPADETCPSEIHAVVAAV